MLRLLKRRPLHQFTQSRLPFLLPDLVSNGASINPQTILSPFAVSFFSSAASSLRHKSIEMKKPIFDFFHSYGFADTQIERFIQKYRADRPPEAMKPNLEHLLSFGFSPSEIVKTISYYPNILTASLKKGIKPNLKILETKFGSKTDIIKAIIRGPWLLTRNLEKNTIPNINILRENGIPTDIINRLFVKSPLTLDKDCNVITESVNKLKVLGMSLSTLTFVNGLSVMATYKKETWERKLELYRSLGWSEKDTLWVFSTQPTCLTISDDKIKEKMNFFEEKLEWDSALVAKRPIVLLYSLEGRIIPRCAALNVLAKKKLWEGKPNLYSLFIMAERNFKERFVNKYEKEVPQVVDAYEGKVEFKGFDPSIALNQSQAGAGV